MSAKTSVEKVAALMRSGVMNPRVISDQMGLSLHSARNYISAARRRYSDLSRQKNETAAIQVASSSRNPRGAYSVGNPVTMAALWSGLERWRVAI